MRKIIFLLFIIFSNVMQLFGNNWYVSTTSSGNASGDSWTNSALYTSFSQGQLSAGDTVYIDGGVSSMIYRALWTITADGTAGANIIFTRGKDANHNGVPIFRQPVNSNNHTINFYDSRYVELSYIKTDTCGNGMRTINLTGGSHHIDIVHNDIVYVTGTGVQLNTASDVRIMHNNFTTGVIDNTYNNDAIWSGMTTLNLEVAYNYFLGQNTATANPNHKDFMQINGNAGVCSIHHNFFRADRSTYQSIYTENGTGTLNIYNNIIDQTGTTLPGSIFNLKSPEQGQTINVYNNVLICGTYDVIGFYTPTILNFKNNLVKISSYRMEINPYNNSFTNVNFDYNQYIIPGTYGFSNQGDNSFASWQNVSTYNYPDINSSTTGFTLVDAPSVTATNYMLTENSSGKDEGTDLSSIFTTDFRDTVRTGAWDVGAFENVDSSYSNIKVKCKVFLQGPFSTNSMMTNLSQNSLLPNTQPFNTAPWNYSGSESLVTNPSSSYVDWVLVELRNSANPSQVIARGAAILKNDGTLLNTDGSIGISFNNVQEGPYYIAIFHRNHLPIMSANPVQLSANSPVYDFTNGMNKAYGTDPMANLGDGKFGMYASDGNSNGGITITDRNEIWVPQNGTMGYLKGDFNLDGGVTASDVNLYWNLNNGTMTQVP